jgi:4-nitrophenyl phosphatase
VLWKSNTILPGAIDFLSLIRSQNKKVLFLTNNCLKTRSEYWQKLNQVGITAKIEEVRKFLISLF